LLALADGEHLRELSEKNFLKIQGFQPVLFTFRKEAASKDPSARCPLVKRRLSQKTLCTF
jgi:hypothetical protein